MAVEEFVILALKSHFRIDFCGFLIVLGVEACADRKHEHYLVSVFRAQNSAESFETAAASLSAETGSEENTVTAARAAVVEYHVVGTRAVVVIVVVSAVNSARERHSTRLRGSDTNDHYLIGSRNKDFARVYNVSYCERVVRDSRTNVKLTVIVLCPAVELHADIQVAEWHIVAHIRGNALHLFKGDFLRFLYFLLF